MRQPTILKQLALVLSLCLTLGLVACFNTERDAALEDFRRAVEAGNPSLARDIYVEEKTRKGFDKAFFLRIVEEEITGIGQAFSEGNLSYDQAILSLDALQFTRELTDDLQEKIAEVSDLLRRGDTIEADLAQAGIYAEAKDFVSSLALYDEILAKFPENAEVRTARAEVLGDFALQADTRAGELAREGLPRAALAIVEQALSYDRQNQALLIRKASLERTIEAKDAEIRAQIPKIELNLLLRKGDLLGAQKYLDEVSEMGVDVSSLQPLLDERVNLYISAVLESASSLATTNFAGRWTQNPYRQAIAKLEEALALYPQDPNLLAAKSRYESLTPDNVTADVSVEMGTVTRDATGTDAHGYTYERGGFDEALSIKPDVRFSYDMGGYQKTRIILSPRTADTSVYSNMVIRITVDGETVLEAEQFASSLNAIDLTLDTSSDSVVQIRVQQSGFASFFEGILGRNQLFVELYRYN